MAATHVVNEGETFDDKPVALGLCSFAPHREISRRISELRDRTEADVNVSRSRAIVDYVHG